MESNFFKVCRSREANILLSQIVKDVTIEGPIGQRFKSNIDQYVNGKINLGQYFNNLINLKNTYSRWKEALNFYVQRISSINRINLKDPKERLVFINQVFRAYHNEILNYATTNIQLGEIEKKFNNEIKKQKRHNYINQLIKAMKESEEFDNLPNNFMVYFGNHFQRYLTDENISLPELLRVLEEKHQNILASMPSGLIKERRNIHSDLKK